MNRYSVIAIVLSVIVGLVVGSIFSTSQKNKEIVKLAKQHEIQLKQEISNSKKLIETYNIREDSLVEIISLDSIKISAMEHRIKQDGVVVEQLRKERAKWTNEEKVNYLTNRYTN